MVMILSAARIVFCCCCKRLTYSLGFSKLCAMASSSLTARLAADAIELTRAAYKPSVCSWYPHCSMPATAWACGCVGKLGARSEQQAAEQQQRQPVLPVPPAAPHPLKPSTALVWLFCTLKLSLTLVLCFRPRHKSVSACRRRPFAT